MKIIIDDRERELYDRMYSIVHTEGHVTNIQLVKRIIPLGDILIETDEDKPVAIIERKSLTDLLASIKDGRYDEQSHRLLHSCEIHPHNIIYLIEGQMSTLRSIMEKKIVYSAITSLQYFKGFSVYRTMSMAETAEWIIWTANKIDRELVKGKPPAYLTKNSNTVLNATDIATMQPSYVQFVKKVKRDNITPDNMGEILLTQIPGISSITAAAIMKHFDTFPLLLIELGKNPQCLNNITIDNGGKSRKLSKTVLENIVHYLRI